MSRAPRPLVSVCILAGHGHELLDACLASLEEQIAPPSFELLVGVSSKEMGAVVERRFPGAAWWLPGAGHPGWRRNELIARARGDLLLFLDDDVTVAPDLLGRLAGLAAGHPEVVVFGGPNETPAGSSPFQTIQGAVLSSIIGAGPVSRRYGARRPCAADERWFTLCNLAVRREAMLPFRRDLVCAEENAVLAELRAHGELMRYEPGLRVFHRRRGTWPSFARQMFKYGRGRGQLLVRQPRVTRLAFLAPTVLLLYGLALVGLVLDSRGTPPLPVLLPGLIYVALLLASSAWIATTLRAWRAFPLAGGLILTVHACYGCGVVAGSAHTVWSLRGGPVGAPAPSQRPLRDPGTDRGGSGATGASGGARATPGPTARESDGSTGARSVPSNV